VRRPRDLPGLRLGGGRRRAEAVARATRGRARDRCAGVLPRELHEVFHRRVLERPFALSRVLFSKALLFQHWGDGDGFGAVEGGELQEEDRELDGTAEEEEDL